MFDGKTECCVVCGDCLDVMAGISDACIDTIITDPPYGLKFMGKDWDHDVPGSHFWEAALRVAKPGAMLLAFGGTRTYHRLACAIEDAGWQIRDCLMWLYGSGFPKSHNISIGIDKAAKVMRHRGIGITVAGYTNDKQVPGKVIGPHEPIAPLACQWDGWGTALKPAWEPIILAMKPLDGTFAQNAEKHGVAGLNIDGGRIESGADYSEVENSPRFGRSSGNRASGDNRPWIDRRIAAGLPTKETEPHPQGRWPANLLLDESAGELLDEQSGELHSGSGIKTKAGSNGGGFAFGDFIRPNEKAGIGGDSGGASRFFYCAKASRSERNAGLRDGGVGALRDGGVGALRDGGVGALRDGGRSPKAQNHHPTIKPLALMEYLCRLTATPTGGIVLDPFAGSGTTGMACVATGRKFIGIDISEEYCEIARKRIKVAMTQQKTPKPRKTKRAPKSLKSSA